MENWKAVVGFEGIYEVSDAGHVRRIADWTDGRKHKSFKRTLKGRKKKSGYVRIFLYADQKRHDLAMHRIVLAAFVGPIPLGYQVNHRNGQKDDNRLENLEYATPRENNLHRYRVLGVYHFRGAEAPNAKLTEDDVFAMRGLRKHGWRVKDVAKEFSISESTCSEILNNKLWKHI